MFRLGAALDSRLWEVDGGVRGRELEPETLLPQLVTATVEVYHETYKELKLSMSACE